MVQLVIVVFVHARLEDTVMAVVTVIWLYIIQLANLVFDSGEVLRNNYEFVLLNTTQRTVPAPFLPSSGFGSGKVSP